MAIDADGNLYINDTGNLRVRKVSPDGVISTFAGNDKPFYKFPADGSLATDVQLYPEGLAVDPAGNVLVSTIASGGRSAVLKISKSGIATRLAGSAGGNSADGTPARTAMFSANGLAIDAAGRILVSDAFSIRMLEPVRSPVQIGAVVDAANERVGPVSPGKIVVIYGDGLGPAQLVNNLPTAGLFSNQLAGTSVLFNGMPGPILYTSATQIGAVTPYGVTGDTVQISVSYQGQVSDGFTVPLNVASPGIFSRNGTGAGQASALNGDGTANDAAHPVKTGGYLSIFASGAGSTLPASADGQIAPSTPPEPQTALPVNVTVGGVAAPVLYAGPAPGELSGMMQVVIQIPPSVAPGGYVPVVLQVGESSTVNGAIWISVDGNAISRVVN